MDLISRFIPIQAPRQYIFLGEEYADIFRLPDDRWSRKKAENGRGWLRKSVPFLNDDVQTVSFRKIKGELAAVDTGIILHPGFFIYNIFEFDRIPFPEKLRQELIHWRLEKIFPEDIGAYCHRFFKLDRRRIFSILIRKNLVEAIEAAARDSGITLIYIGNSTVEISNHLFHPGTGPDFFVEITGTVVAIVFKQRGAPVYVRKLKCDSTEDLIQEIEKTVQFVRAHFSLTPVTYQLISYHEEIPAAEIETTLLCGGLTRKKEQTGEFPFLPLPS